MPPTFLKQLSTKVRLTFLKCVCAYTRAIRPLKNCITMGKQYPPQRAWNCLYTIKEKKLSFPQMHLQSLILLLTFCPVRVGATHIQAAVSSGMELLPQPWTLETPVYTMLCVDLKLSWDFQSSEHSPVYFHKIFWKLSFSANGGKKPHRIKMSLEAETFTCKWHIQCSRLDKEQ